MTLQGATDTPANSWSGNFTLQMVDNNLNQDSCESGSVPLTVTVGDPAGGASLSDIVYYTTTNSGNPFTRSLTPIVSGPIDDTVGAGPSVNLSITSATGYADNGFYMVLGTLGNLTNGYTITGSGSGFGTNLYFNTNPTGNDFFEWGGPQYTVYTTVPGNTSYILGPRARAGILR